jgi:hypothetical protein
MPDILNQIVEDLKSYLNLITRYQLALNIMDNNNIQNIKNNNNAFNFLNETYEVMKW